MLGRDLVYRTFPMETFGQEDVMVGNICAWDTFWITQVLVGMHFW